MGDRGGSCVAPARRCSGRSGWARTAPRQWRRGRQRPAFLRSRERAGGKMLLAASHKCTATVEYPTRTSGQGPAMPLALGCCSLRTLSETANPPKGGDAKPWIYVPPALRRERDTTARLPKGLCVRLRAPATTCRERPSVVWHRAVRRHSYWTRPRCSDSGRDGFFILWLSCGQARGARDASSVRGKPRRKDRGPQLCG